MIISWLISRLLWVSATPQSIHENVILAINWQSSNLLILFPGCYLMILSLSVLILWLTWNKNLCSSWSNWPKITHIILYFLNSSQRIDFHCYFFIYYIWNNIYYEVFSFQTSLYIHFSLLFVFNSNVMSIIFIV